MTHFRRSEGKTAREAKPQKVCQSLFKMPPADVPVRVREAVVAVHAGEAGVSQAVIQVAKGQPPRRRPTDGCAINPYDAIISRGALAPSFRRPYAAA